MQNLRHKRSQALVNLLVGLATFKPNVRIAFWTNRTSSAANQIRLPIMTYFAKQGLPLDRTSFVWYGLKTHRLKGCFPNASGEHADERIKSRLKVIYALQLLRAGAEVTKKIAFYPELRRGN